MSLIERFVSRTLCVGLAPDQFTCVIRKGGNFIAKEAHRQRLSHPERHWQPALDAMKTYLQENKSGRAGLPVAAVVSAHWSRMMMVPWSDALLKRSIAPRFLQDQFAALYGDEARDWMIVCDNAPYGQTRLACAMERGLVELFRQMVMAHHHVCRSFEPLVSAALRVVAGNVGKQTKAFAVVEAGMISLACVNRGRIVAVQSQPWAHSWTDALSKAWQRWTLRLPELADITQVIVVNLTEESTLVQLPAPFTNIQPFSSDLGPAYGLVACGRGR